MELVAGGSPRRRRRLLEERRYLAVRIGGDGDLAQELREACGGDGPTLIVDPLWGAPLEAAVEAAAPGARIVHYGQSAGPTATLTSAAVRGKQLDLLGYSDFALSREARDAGYRRLVELATAGSISIELERVPLDGVAEAWRRQGEGPGAKLVVVP